MRSSSLTSLPSDVLWKIINDTGQCPNMFLAFKLFRDTRHQCARNSSVFGNDHADLSPLLSFSSLQTLHCHSIGITDLSPLPGIISLTILRCTGCHGINDLSPLSSLSSLQNLDLSYLFDITDLSPLSSLSSLQTLDCRYCRGNTDLSPLSCLLSLQINGS